VAVGATATAAAASLAITAALLGAPAAQAGSLPTSTQFYADPNAQAARWVTAHPTDSRAAAINNRIAQVASGIWFSNYSPSTVTSAVRTVTSAASSAGKTPVLVLYAIPNRDCGGASAGGAPDLTSYGSYVSNFAAGLGSGSAVIILEPDSLALQTCLSAADATARDNAIAQAVQTLKTADASAKVYLDAGHSAWNSAGDQAGRLNAAGVRNADGFYSNVSNFNPTGNEVSYDKAILSSLGNPSNLHAVVDTSRNGNGSNGQWCDPTGRALGPSPTANTGDAAIDAYLWVKPPGESDGCADAAGVFDPALAYAFITNGPGGTPSVPPLSPTPTRTASPTPSRTTGSPTPTASPTPTRTSASPTPSRTTASPTPTPTGGSGGASCRVSYVRQSEWTNGFVAQLTIVNSGTATINAWVLKFTYPGDQKVTSAWNSTVTQSGSAVTVTNAGYNGTIAPGANVGFGFQGTFASSDASPTGFTVNGSTCSLG
jgi:endoglucanase